MEAGAEFGIRPCGLGARNTLRLEAGMSLYGHEISEEINVLEAGLDRWLKLDKGEFHWARCVAGGAGSRRAEAQDRGPGDGGARHRARRVPGTVLGGRRDRRSHVGFAGAVFEDEYRDGAGAGGGGGERNRCAGAGAAAIRCARSRCRCRFTSGPGPFTAPSSQ